MRLKCLPFSGDARRIEVSINTCRTAAFLYILLGLLAAVCHAQPLPYVGKIIDVPWLKAQSPLHNKDIVVVDVRRPEEYQVGHIPGAVNVPVETTFTSHRETKLVASISQIRQVFGQAGISKQAKIILYDDGSFIDAARVFWVLEVYGHENAAILGSGLPGWQKAGFELTQVIPRVTPTRFVPTVSPSRMATKLSTRLAIDDKDTVIIDARSEEEYSGQKSKYDRFGHIPTSVNVPWDKNYEQKDGITEIKPLNDLQELYKGFDRNKKYIAYCNSGKQSALTYFVLRQLGYDVSAYDGSWEQWSKDKRLPISGARIKVGTN